MNSDYRECPTDAVLQMLDETAPIITRRYPSLRNVVIVRDQTVLCARAFHRTGVADGSRDPDVISPVHSVTKSVVALLIGILIDRGQIQSVEQPLTDLLSSRSKLTADTPVGRLTLHQLLSMTTGLLWRNARAGLEPMVGRMMKQSDWLEFVLALPVEQAKCDQFQYNSAVSHVLSAIVQEVSGQTTADFAAEVLFSPLNIKDYLWESDSQQISIGGWGLSLSALSMAKIGQLCVDRGKVDGRQVVAEAWIEQMWAPHSVAHSLHAQHQPVDYGATSYGYQWWIRGNDRIRLYCAEGLGGQSVYCIPAHRSVIVTSSDYPGRRHSLWPLFEQHWIPAAVDG